MLGRVIKTSKYQKLAQYAGSTLNFEAQSYSMAKRNLSSVPEEKKEGLFERLFGAKSSVSAPEFKNRWGMAIPAVGLHMCIGSPYAWSIMSDMVTKEYGFVTSAAADWSLMQTALPLSIVFVFHGLSSSLIGKWQVEAGPRKSMALASFVFGGALALGSAGVYLHSLPLLYLGYGVLGGIGIGLGYTPPVQTLMQWFPDRKGIASGLAIAGFGSGALLFGPSVQYLTKMFAKLPTYLGPSENFITKTVDGKLFADVDGSLIEVVKAGATELSKIPYSLSEGLYIVGSGSTGAAEALGVMSLAYFTVMMAASLSLKNPHPSYVPAGWTPPTAPTTSATAAPVKLREFTVEEAVRTPQFYLLGTTFYCLATGGMGMFSVAKPMMSEVFSSALPTVVTSAFAAKFVLMLSMGNLLGRLGWAAISDVLGRRNTFMIFSIGSIPIYLSLPYLVESVISTGSATPLYLFCVSTMAAVSGMGGAFAVVPAYEADLFGTKNVAAIHGRMLLCSSAAAITGPFLLLKLRSIAETNAINDLMTKIAPEKFEAVFGAPMEKASELIAAKTLTISKLLALAPPGTLDPTPHLYDQTMYTLSGMMAMAVISHALIKPIDRTIQVTAQEVTEKK